MYASYQVTTEETWPRPFLLADDTSTPRTVADQLVFGSLTFTYMSPLIQIYNTNYTIIDAKILIHFANENLHNTCAAL